MVVLSFFCLPFEVYYSKTVQKEAIPMSAFVDFKELKASVTIEQVLHMLGIQQLKRHGEQLRGRCPIHNGTGDRDFVVTPAKGLFYCFGGCGGGDMIKLVAKVKDCDQKEAAHLIAGHFRNCTVPRNSTVPGTVPSTAPQNQKGQLKPLDYLQATHEAVQALGVSPETCLHFEAGYAGKGIMRGRLAIPIHQKDGTLLAYCGRAVGTEQQPTLSFPNGFDPSAVIFGAHRLKEGTVYLVRDPLQVLLAFESGIENVVAFLGDITPQQLEMLAALCDERKCDTVELF
jgi:DNA primase